MKSASTWRRDSRRCARSAACPGVKKAYGISSCRQALRAGRKRTAGGDRVDHAAIISSPCRNCSSICARTTATMSNCCTTCTIASRRIEAARLARDLEPHRLFWLEDATPAENQKSFELIRKHSVTPLAVGEVFNSIWDCKHLIENQLIDYIRTTIVHGGGITHMRRLADFAALAPGAHRLPRRHRPVAGVHGRGVALRHLGAELRHPGIHDPFATETDEVFPHDYVFRDGRLHVRRYRRAMAWTSTRSSPRTSRTRRSSCRSRVWKTARCGTGERVGQRSDEHECG